MRPDTRSPRSMSELHQWLILAFMLACLTHPAVAQTRDDNARACIGKNLDLVISACTALLDSGQETTPQRATELHNRGLAYMLKGLPDRAIQDFDQAIRIQP